MSFPRFSHALLLAFSLLLFSATLYAVPVILANQHGQETQAEKPPAFQYVCPMHDDVISKKPGKCRKCNMTLVKKKIKASKPADQ